VKLLKFTDTWRGAMAENRFSRWAIGGLIITNMILIFVIAGKDRTVVIVPPEIKGQVEISRASANEGYLEAWTLSLAILLGNITPGNASTVKKNLEPFLAPEIFNDVTVNIDRAVSELTHSRITLKFEPLKVVFEPGSKKWFATGYRTQTGPADDGRREQATYEMQWEIRNFRPVLTRILHYTGKPRTEKELDRLTADQERAERRARDQQGR
jgi:conjugal transfer pilus assembly protein TraE